MTGINKDVSSNASIKSIKLLSVNFGVIFVIFNCWAVQGWWWATNVIFWIFFFTFLFPAFLCIMLSCKKQKLFFLFSSMMGPRCWRLSLYLYLCLYLFSYLYKYSSIVERCKDDDEPPVLAFMFVFVFVFVSIFIFIQILFDCWAVQGWWWATGVGGLKNRPQFFAFVRRENINVFLINTNTNIPFKRNWHDKSWPTSILNT